MKITDIKKELRKVDHEQLIDFIVDLYKKHKSVKAQLDFFLNPNEQELFTNYQDKILYAFFPKQGYILKYEDAKQAITDFKKFNPSSSLVAELMLFYTEMAVKLTYDIGIDDDRFYGDLEFFYFSALTLMKKENLLDKFAEHAAKVVNASIDLGCTYDCLSQDYEEFYSKKAKL